MADSKEGLISDQELLNSNEIVIITHLNLEDYSQEANALLGVTNSLRLQLHDISEYSQFFNNLPIEEATLWVPWGKEEAMWKECRRFVLVFEFFDLTNTTLMQKYLTSIAKHLQNDSWSNPKEIYPIILTKNSDIKYRSESTTPHKWRLWSIKPFQKWAETIHARYIYPSVVMQEDGNAPEELKKLIILSLLKKQTTIIRQKHKTFYKEKIYDK